MTINRGVIPGRKKSDFVAGTLPYEIRNSSGDWTPFLVRTEKQYFNSFDTMACVSFSALSCCEIQIKQQTGVEVNFSDRFLAKMSGTTHQGNWLYIVADTLRSIGSVLEDEWPVLPGLFDWNDYYITIPQFVIDRAKPQFRDKYKIEYETVPINATEVLKALKHAPLQIVIPGHAIAAYGMVVSISGNKVKYLDTYDPYLKETDLSNISDIYKIVLTVKGNPKMEIFQIEGEQTLVIKNFAGQYSKIATPPELYPLVERALGLKAVTTIPKVSKATVEANPAPPLQGMIGFSL